MGQSRLSRRAVLKTAALGSAAVITAPYVSGVHAGQFDIGMLGSLGARREQDPR
jgi:hypothetical protein